MSSTEKLPGAVGNRVVTVLESVESIRAAAGRFSTLKEAVPTAAPKASSAAQPAAAPATDDARPFRPQQRPSMALLVVFDDGDDEGETIRIRSGTFVIGRVEGDLVIPHDGGMSGKHVEISRRLDRGESRWFLRDLNSTNGTFVRAATVILNHGQEILLGGKRLRFEIPAAIAEEAQPIAGTQKWQVLTPGAAPKSQPSLVELMPQGPGRRFALTGADTPIGRERSCSIVLDDPMISPRHARITQDAKGRWCIQNTGSRNGVWARVEEVPLERGGQFQCGEQRFLIKIL
jgi:pSer/pThr/pTyr-binding forkhead associated (FHA) protein